MMHIVDSIPVELDDQLIIRTLRLRKGTAIDIEALIQKCRPLIEPRAIFTSLKIAKIEKEEVTLENGYTLKGTILADRLQPEQTVVPHVVTIGPNLEEHISEYSKGNTLQAFIIEKIADTALGKARSYVRSYVQQTLGGSISNFSPGSGTGKLFGIEQQAILFRILEPSRIGVSLSPSYLMIPRKSSSGIFASCGSKYVACQYCPRERCESRSVPFSGEYRHIIDQH